VRRADNRDGRADSDPLKKQGSGISGHPYASVGRRISWEISSVHPNRRAELHEVRHRRGLIMITPAYVGAGSRIWVNHSSISVDD
jgi:hypothetical protein